MQFSELANELVLQIFQSCNSVQDVLNLAFTNRHFHSLLSPVRKLPVLYSAAERQYGPLSDAVQVITYNSSQPAHQQRMLPETLHNIKSIVEVGKVAKKWEAIYPEKKWKVNYVDRRSLTTEECYRLRRAVYRAWLYSAAFHNERYVRTTRSQQSIIAQRAVLLRNWTTAEIADIEDVRLIIRAVLEDEVCPSNATVQGRPACLSPRTKHRILPRPYLTYQTLSVYSHHGWPRQWDPFFPTSAEEPTEEGWGDEISHYYVVEDMMKLTPGQVLWMQHNAPLKCMVEAFKGDLGEWFDNNGDTFSETVHWVCSKRKSEHWFVDDQWTLRGHVLAERLGITHEEVEDIAEALEDLELSGGN